MNYKKIYDDLIESRSKMEREVYTEKHHILPRSWGGSDNKENLVRLTGKEHWIAHLLLSKIATGQNKYKAFQSVLQMGRIITEDKRKTSRLYERARIEIAAFISKKHKGKIVARCQKTKEIIGMVSKDHPKIISGEWAHHMKGRTLSKERSAMCACPGEKNGRYSGITDEEIVDFGLEIFEKIQMIPSLNNIREYVLKKYNKQIPKHFSKFRFPDKSLMEILEERTNEKFNSYRRGNERDEYNKRFKGIMDD